jgi:hypothetical protein
MRVIEETGVTMIRRSFVIISLLLLSTLSPVSAGADFFQYTDQSGTVVMVDDESKIPAQFRKKARTTRSGPAVESKVTSVRMRGNQAIVPVRISYRNAVVDAWLMLDTGATVTVISTALAGRLGIRASHTEGRLA